MVGEDLAVRPAELFPTRDIGYEHPGPDDVRQVGAEIGQRFRDDFETAFRLLVTVTRSVDDAILHSCRARDENPIAGPQGPAVPDPSLLRSTAEHALKGHTAILGSVLVA